MPPTLSLAELEVLPGGAGCEDWQPQLPGEGGGSRDPERREMSIFSGGGSDNREAGDQGGPTAPLAKVIW